MFFFNCQSVPKKDKSAIPPLFNGPGYCLLHLIKQNCLLKTFLRTLNLDDSGISLPVFPSRTNLKLHVSVTPMMVKKIIMNLDLSKASGPDCIPVVVLKNCEPELSYILAELFNVCLEESCFPDYWKVSLVVPILKNTGERSIAKNYGPALLIFFLCLLKSLKNLIR